MTIVLGGDFQQILPVITTGEKEYIIDTTIRQSYLWPHFKILTLQENMKLKQHNISPVQKIKIPKFSNWLLNISDGTFIEIKDPDNEDATWIEIPEKFLLHYDASPFKKITHLVNNNLINNFDNVDYLKQFVNVALKNKTVDEIN